MIRIRSNTPTTECSEKGDTSIIITPTNYYRHNKYEDSPNKTKQPSSGVETDACPFNSSFEMLQIRSIQTGFLRRSNRLHAFMERYPSLPATGHIYHLACLRGRLLSAKILKNSLKLRDHRGG